MFFRSRYIVRHWGMHDVPEPLRLEKPGPHRVVLSMRTIRDDEIRQFYEKDDWVAELVTDEDISDKIRDQFCLPDEEPQRPAVTDVSRNALMRMHGFLMGFLQLARWRTGVYGHHELIRCVEGGLDWSLDEVTWSPARLPGKGVGSSELRSTTHRPKTIEDITALLLRDERAPTAHELLREAWNLKPTSPRSALMLGLSALEVGVKAFVATIVPNSEWLCFEVPTPPVVRILREYLPQLPVRQTIGGKVFVPDATLNTIKKATEQRNRVAHRGVRVEYSQSLNEVLSSVQTVLFLLDYYAGHSWALNNIRESAVLDELRKALGTAGEPGN
jgi:hypothetical protein